MERTFLSEELVDSIVQSLLGPLASKAMSRVQQAVEGRVNAKMDTATVATSAALFARALNLFVTQIYPLLAKITKKKNKRFGRQLSNSKLSNWLEEEASSMKALSVRLNKYLKEFDRTLQTGEYSKDSIHTSPLKSTKT